MAEAGKAGVTAEHQAMALAGRSLRIVVIAGEHSGDLLGGRLMRALADRHAGAITYAGVGGEHMEAEGLKSVFPLSDVAVMGPAAILKRLPTIVRRVYTAVDAALAFEPDIVVIIDSPEFTHPIAKRIRRRRPSIPIVDYVSPSVWAWRPGRARKMRPYVDHVMALLPFEPAAHARLGGPPCTYVGHPMIERYDWIKSRDGAGLAARLGLVKGRPVIVVLPGSRPSEVARLMRPFGESLRALVAKGIEPEVVVPAVASVRGLIEAELAHWPVRPHLVAGEDDKFAAFRLADAALAASGTVTLELALAGTPAIVAYRVDGVARHLRFLVKVPSIVLANLVAGRNIYPEFIQEACNGEQLAEALAHLLRDGRARQHQIDGLLRIPERMLLVHGTPSERAADVVLAHIAR
ncbi:MAG: lipid-A-disaccharide synthase [Hyphomicrobiaceae bacterium]